ncbi:unnamed protein product [Penicillium salamii]|nr:unnamed protein product [Penicillium salamii]CAG8267887.1 unnamed protein product [Penicillium salamii]
MFRSALRPFSSFPCSKSARFARSFHRVTTDFITLDGKGERITTKVPIIIGDPGESYVLVYKEHGDAFRAARPPIPASSASVQDGYRLRLTFFHDSQHFGFGSTSYPRLYIPEQMPRQTESNTSLASIFMSGKMDQLVLDGTADGIHGSHHKTFLSLIY